MSLDRRWSVDMLTLLNESSEMEEPMSHNSAPATVTTSPQKVIISRPSAVFSTPSSQIASLSYEVLAHLNEALAASFSEKSEAKSNETTPEDSLQRYISNNKKINSCRKNLVRLFNDDQITSAEKKEAYIKESKLISERSKQNTLLFVSFHSSKPSAETKALSHSIRQRPLRNRAELPPRQAPLQFPQTCKSDGVLKVSKPLNSFKR